MTGGLTGAAGEASSARVAVQQGSADTVPIFLSVDAAEFDSIAATGRFSTGQVMPMTKISPEAADTQFGAAPAYSLGLTWIQVIGLLGRPSGTPASSP